MKKKIPKDWLKYPKMGDLVENSRFIAMKVPLETEKLCVIKNEKFNCQNAIDMIEEKGLKIGMVVNLCDTDKYYYVTNFTTCGVAVKKIPVEGQKLPRKYHMKNSLGL